MSEDEIQGPFAKKPTKPFHISDEELVSLAERSGSPQKAEPRADIHYTSADLSDTRVVEHKGNILAPPIFFPQPATPTTNMVGLEAIVVYDEQQETDDKEIKAPAEPMPAHPPIILDINDAQVDADVESFYRLSDYEPRRSMRKYAAAAAVLIAATLAGSSVGITYRPAQGTDVAPILTKTTVSTGTGTPESGLETTTEQRGKRCEVCGQENCSYESNRQNTQHGGENIQNQIERPDAPTTERRPNTPQNNTLAGFIGNYQFRTEWNGTRRVYTLDGTTTEKAQAYNLLTRIAFEDRLRDPNAKMTYLEATLFERCDPDKTRRITDGYIHISLSDVQRVANQYANLRQN